MTDDNKGTDDPGADTAPVDDAPPGTRKQDNGELHRTSPSHPGEAERPGKPTDDPDAPGLGVLDPDHPHAEPNEPA